MSKESGESQEEDDDEVLGLFDPETKTVVVGSESDEG